MARDGDVIGPGQCGEDGGKWKCSRDISEAKPVGLQSLVMDWLKKMEAKGSMFGKTVQSLT